MTFCDTAESSILVQQHINGSALFNGSAFFHRSWAEFKAGFGSSSAEYWIGNDRLHNLTKEGRYKVRFDLQSSVNNEWYWAEYSTFIVDDESTGYMLHVLDTVEMLGMRWVAPTVLGSSCLEAH